MKFHRISLRDYRGIRSCVIEPRESGVTVIEGDNEIGKSSIAEALWLIFEQHDDSSSQLVKSLRPADRDAATEIDIEVSTGPYRFTYFKRFHRGPRTELKVLAPQREILAGREADNRARQILEETIDTSLWKALRSQQGVQESLDPPAAGQHRSLLGALDTAAGPLMGGEREQALFAAAQHEYEKYFTGSGREKSAGEGPSAPKLRTAESAALAEVEQIRARMEMLEEKAQRAANLESLLAQLDGQLELASTARASLVTAEQRRAAAAGEVDRARAALAAAESSVRELTSERDARQRTLSAIAPRQEAMHSLAAEAEHAAPQLAAAQAILAKAQAEHEEAAGRRAGALASVRQAEDLVQLSARQLQVDQMAERLARLDRLEPEIAELSAWLATCKLDRRLVTELEDLDRKLAVLDARREAEAAAVEITSADAAVIAVNGQDVALAAGQTRRGKVRGETTINLPGGITVAIKAGSAAREIEEQVRAVRHSLEARLEAAGVGSLQAARDVLTERTANEERRKQFTSQVQNDLRDLKSAEELRAKLQRERDAIRQVLEAARLDTAPSVEEAKAQRDLAAAAASGAEADYRLAAEALDSATRAIGALEREAEIRQARIATLREELERAEQELESQRSRQADAALDESLAAAESARAGLSEALIGCEAEFASLVDQSEALRGAELEIDRLARAANAARMEEAGIRALLEDAGADGLHGKLVDAEQRLTAATDELESFSRRAAAARLLFETLRTRRDQARESYAGPLKECIESLGRRVYNASFAVELSEDLRIIRRSLDGITLDLPQVSVGAREQLSVLTRLACAALVSKDGGAPLVLDDILGWADPKRLEALGPILAEAAGESQVLLFTCSPERFASVRPARVISLPTGRSVERDLDADIPPAGEVDSRIVKSAAAVRAPAAAARAPQGAFELFEVDPARRVN